MAIWEEQTEGGSVWRIGWTDEDGRRRTRRIGHNRREAERVLARKVAEVDEVRRGLVSRTDRDRIEQRRRPIAEHLSDYLADAEHSGQASMHVHNKKVQLEALIEGVGGATLDEIEPNAVQRFLRQLKREGKSARTINSHRAHANAFLNWCVKQRRISENPLKVIPRLDERKDRRRVRRAFTPEELGDLVRSTAALSEAGARRSVLYLVAALTGLRRGELRKLTWGDADLDAGALTVRIGVGKAARDDVIPLHPEARDALRSIRPRPTKPSGRVFATVPRPETVKFDLQRAGIDPGEASVGEGVLDLHATRTTIGTQLARAGVAPQVAQRFLRHADMATTLRHYTRLVLTDLAPAVAALSEPEQVSAEAVATGTDCAHPERAAPRNAVQTDENATDRRPAEGGGLRLSSGDTSSPRKDLQVASQPRTPNGGKGRKLGNSGAYSSVG
ncbi:MAG: hypothetical protein DHS20C14_22200 [Phycisphaeraceae bacterium]|nr:MAG: hypothetical protein DHS20C14_22200 [Phycisphaeraceae bacterium]